MTIEQGAFRHAMSHFPTGVTVVTTLEGTELVGMTVSSFASLSLDPPLVLICIDRKTRSHDAIADTGAFIVNILTDRQEVVSRRFAVRGGDKFLPGTYYLSERGLPVLADTLGTLECRVVNALPGGDHTIYVAEVLTITVNSGEPLLYFRSQYRRLVPFDLLPGVMDE